MIDKEITCSITGTSSGTRYKLYNNSHNTSLGNNTGKKNKTGFRNISLGNNAGPMNVSDSDKLYISSNNVSRGDQSFIYGNMEEGSEELLINGSLKINGKGGLSQNGTDTKSITFPSERGNSGETFVLGSNGVLSWGASSSSSSYPIFSYYDPTSYSTNSIGASWESLFTQTDVDTGDFEAETTKLVIELSVSLYIRTFSTGSSSLAMFRLSKKVDTNYYEITSSYGYGLDTGQTEKYFKKYMSTAGTTSEYVVDHTYETIKWYISGLTVGNTYRFYVQAKNASTSTASSIYLYSGGSWPPCILKGYFI